MLRRDSVSGKIVWDTANPDNTLMIPGAIQAGGWEQILPQRLGLHFVEPACDLDGDGTRDMILVVSNSYAMVALSGKDGSMLWNYVAGASTDPAARSPRDRACPDRSGKPADRAG